MYSVLDRLGAAMQPFIGDGLNLRLNLGCGRQQWPDWTNIDRMPAPGVDLVLDLESFRFPYADDSVSCILACHVLEHIRDLMPMMEECHRVLKPGARLIAVTPHMGSDDAWEDPTHVRAFSERSWMYFDQRTYQGTGHAGCYEAGVHFSFEVEYLHLVPMPDWIEAAKVSTNNLELERRRYRNVIQEMRTVLRKVAV